MADQTNQIAYDIFNNNKVLLTENNNHDLVNANSPVAGPSGIHIPVAVKRKSWVRCDVCKVAISSQRLMQLHLAGKKHYLNSRKAFDNSPGNKKQFRCDICNVNANSKTQFNDHISSTKHRAKIEKFQLAVKIKFYCLYGIVIISLLFIIITYVMYLMFLLLEKIDW